MTLRADTIDKNKAARILYHQLIITLKLMDNIENTAYLAGFIGAANVVAKHNKDLAKFFVPLSQLVLARGYSTDDT